MKNIEIYNNSFIDAFHKIENESIDFFLLDLPYATKKFGRAVSCKWDCPIDLDVMWTEIKRTMKPNGICAFFCIAKFGANLIYSNPKMFSYDLVWVKSKKVGFLSANLRQLRQHELIYIFKKKQGTYNPQKTEGKPYKNKGGIKEKDYGTIEGGYYRGENGKPFKRSPPSKDGKRHPTSIIDEKNIGEEEEALDEDTILTFKSVHKNLHKTQKPTELLEHLIKTYTNENDVVMDFTMGSGSTGIACINTNRKFIGVELDKNIFDIAKNRIEKKIEEKIEEKEKEKVI